MSLLGRFPHLSIHLHPQPHPTLELRWQSDITSAELREAMLRSLVWSAEYRVQGWFCNAQLLQDAPSDALLAQPALTQELAWLAQAVLVPLTRLDVRRLAVLAVTDEPTRQATDAMYAQLTHQLTYEIRQFSDPQQARTWATGASLG